MPVGLLYTGNTLDILKELPKESIQTCVTSPPYFGLRDYTICKCRTGRVQHESSTLVGSQAGTPSHFSSADPYCPDCCGTGHRNDLYHVWGGDANCGHQWLEYVRKLQSGGTGCASKKQLSNCGTTNAQDAIVSGECLLCNAWYGSLGNEPTPGLFIKHLVMVFSEIKRVLKDNGTLWVNVGDTYAGGGRGGNPVTSDYQKRKTNVGSLAVSRLNIPSNCKPKDLIGIPWMLAFALRADGWYLRQDIIWHKLNPMPESVTDRFVKAHEYVFLLSKSKDYFFDHIVVREPAVEYAKGKRKVSLGGKSLSKGQATGADKSPSGNALVAEVALNPMRNKRSVWTLSSKPFKEAHFATFPDTLIEPMILAGSKENDTVLDPFSGAATTGLVSLRLGREYIGIEQNPDYTQIAQKRLINAELDCEVL